MKRSLLIFLFLGTVINMFAQFPDDRTMILLGKRKLMLNFQDTVVHVPIMSNEPVSAESSEPWLDVRVLDSLRRIEVSVDANYESSSRSAFIRVLGPNGDFERLLSVEQERERLVDFVPLDIVIPVSHAEASSTQGESVIENTLDGNTETIWHSSWDNSSSDYFPITLTYYFDNVDVINYVRYVPPYNANGRFRELEVYVKSQGDTDFVKYGTYDFMENNVPSIVTFKGGLKHPAAVRFKVLSGGGVGNGFATCAEMEFRKYNPELKEPCSVFVGAMDGLRPGTDQSDIDTIKNPYYKYIAQKIYDDRETFLRGRVQSYKCILSPYTLSEQMKSPGKYYDKFQGVTGINISKGKQAIVVDGLADDEWLDLRVMSWYRGEIGGIGSMPVEYRFELKEGLNVIEYDSEFDGLAYICYYKDNVDDIRPDICVHFINGSVNGFLSPDKTIDELDLILKNATNCCIDLIGEKVHSVWRASSLLNYCKTSQGESKGYLQFMNLLDTLVRWEHYLLGLEKYDRVPENRTMAYVSFGSYMVQGPYGIGLGHTQESRLMDCYNMMYNDDDAIWGLSHEWGHLHQMQPYFCWGGLGESSNNMNSCYNVLHMGYSEDRVTRIRNNWNASFEYFFKDVTTVNKDGYGQDIVSYQYVGPNRGNYIFDKEKNEYLRVENNTGDFIYDVERVGKGAVATKRNESYRLINDFCWSPEVQDSVRSQFARGSRIPSQNDFPDYGLSTNEVYVEVNTAAFFMLYCYFTDLNNPDYVPDFQQDLYESLRQNDNVNGSTVEPGKNKVDKYELLASAQNGNINNKYDEFIRSYPNSCWTKKGFIYKSFINTDGEEVKVHWTQNSVPFVFNYIRKASRLCGYNLFDYFDKLGFLRTVILSIDDYGIKHFVLLPEMKEEFRKDMEALGLKSLTSDMIEKMGHSPLPVFATPDIPNTGSK